MSLRTLALAAPLLALAASPLAAQTALWDSFGNQPGDMYGAGLAGIGDTDGDGTADLLAGAPDAGDGGYVRVLSGVDGFHVRRIGAPLGATRFGAAVADAGDADGDGRTDYVIGAPGEGAADANVYWVFASSGVPGLIVSFPTSVASLSQAGGTALASLGDVDGDGVTDVAVGVPHLNGELPGTVTIIGYSTGGGPTFHGSVHGVANGDRFGVSVAEVGDADGDGVHDIVVGTGAGGYARLHSGATLALLHHFTGAGSDYGSVVGAIGDVNGDGRADVAVASPGLAFVDVFSGATGALLRRFDALGGDFGRALAAVGDHDGDGVPDLGIGAPLDSPLGVAGAGSAVIVSGSTGGQLFKAVGTTAGAHLGGALAAMGDATGDGEAELAVGATGDGSLAVPGTGRALVYDSEQSGLLLPYGFGCPDSFLITPVLELLGTPTAGGPLTLSITRGYPGSTAVVFLGTGQGTLPLGNGCILWVDPLIMPVFLLPLGGTFPGTGAAKVVGVLPAGTPPGLVLTLQAFEAVLDTPGEFASTGAVKLTTY